MFEHFKHCYRIELSFNVVELSENLNSGAGAASIRTVTSYGMHSEQSAHLQEATEAAAKIQNAADPQLSKAKYMRDVIEC